MVLLSHPALSAWFSPLPLSFQRSIFSPSIYRLAQLTLGANTTDAVPVLYFS